MDTIKPAVYGDSNRRPAGATATLESDDGMVKADLSVPKAMGGPGRPGTATPEHLFAAGATRPASAARSTTPPSSTRGRGLGQDHLRRDRPRGRRGFGLAVKMRRRGREPAPGRAGGPGGKSARKVCPYSHATRGNVPVEFEVVGG